MSSSILEALARKKQMILESAKPSTNGAAMDDKASSAPLTKAQLRRQREKANKQQQKEQEALLKQKAEEFAKILAENEKLMMKEEEHDRLQKEVKMESGLEDLYEHADSYEGNPEEEAETEVKLSKKERRQHNLVKVAHLKQIAPRPDLVEPHDITSIDPELLVTLKAVPGSVIVPQHWSQKRRFLENKKGIMKTPFQLPRFIEDTGISEMRNNTNTEERNFRKEMRDRARPKLGRMDIPYDVLHDAFFVHQVKPDLSTHGDIYYEFKEVEDPLKKIHAGKPLSDELLKALGIFNPTPSTPPPWLTNMQVYGPPPGYPYMRVPGVNAPLPVGAVWGDNQGEWGIPPLNEYGQPKFGGELFGQPSQVTPCGTITVNPLRSKRGVHWGAILTSDDVDQYHGEEEEELLAKVSVAGSSSSGAGADADQGDMTDAGVSAQDYSVSLAHYHDAEHKSRAGDDSSNKSGATTTREALGGVVDASGKRALYTVLETQDVAMNTDTNTTNTFVYTQATPAAATTAAANTENTAESKEDAREKEKADLLRFMEQEAEEEERRKRRRQT